MSTMARIRTLLGGSMLAAACAAGPAVADEDVTDQQWNEFHDVLMQAMGAEQLGDVVAQPYAQAWQQMQPPSQGDMTEAQKAEKEQLESGTLVYLVEIPESERVPGGPTHRTVTTPAPMGGTDDMVMSLAGPDGMGSQIQTALTGGDLAPGNMLSGGMPDSSFQNSNIGGMLVDGLSGLQQ